VRVLIARTDALGDNLLSQPLAAKLKAQFPDAKIFFLVQPRVAPLFEGHPYIDGVLIYNRGWSFPSRLIELIKIFKQVRPTHYFFLGGCRLPNWIAFFRRLPFRGGLLSKVSTFLTLNRGVRQQRSIVAMHESEYNLELLAPLNLEYRSEELAQYAPQIVLSAEEKSTAFEQFNTELIESGKKTGHELLFIHPGMTGHTLNWPSRNYGRLITRLERNFPGRFLFVISHTPSDLQHLAGLKDHLDSSEELTPIDRVFFFDGAKQGLRFYMSVLSHASLFIGPSTGTTHIANILGVKTIALYSPIKVQSAFRWGPFHRDPNKLRLIVPDVVCGESFSCAKDACPYYECMSKIEVEDVIKHIPTLLESL
jgi:heptosyltransferase III